MRALYWVLGGLGAGAALWLASEARAQVAPLPKGEILLLGDSLTGNDTVHFTAGKDTLGGNLSRLLQESGRTVQENALGARSAYSFVHGTTQWNKKTHTGKEPGKGKEQLQRAIDSGVQVAVILLGTNDLAGMAKGNTVEATLKPFKAMVSQLRDAGVEVYGIGAPHFPERKDFWPYEESLKDALEDLFGADHFIDAGPLTDGYKMHAGGQSAKDFAKRLFDALTGEGA